jgi:hypothetical protein
MKIFEIGAEAYIRTKTVELKNFQHEIHYTFGKFGPLSLSLPPQLAFSPILSSLLVPIKSY